MNLSEETFSRLLSELRRRKVFRVVIVYALSAWAVVQVCATTFPFLGLPDWTVTVVIVLWVAAFPLAVLLAWAFEITPEGVRRTAPEVGAVADSAAPARPPSAGRRIWFVAGGLTVATLVAIIGFGQVRSGGADLGSGRVESLAVLPFRDASAAGDQEYLSDGLAEELLTALAQVPDLRVASRISSFQFRESGIDIREVGRRLGVQAVLEGSVRRQGERVRISAQLTDAATGFQVWAQTYERHGGDLFLLQEEIAGEILAALQLAHEPGEPLVRRGTNDLAAYDAFLRGNFHLARRTPASLQRALEEYRRASALDSTYIPALLRQAYAYAIILDWGWPFPGRTEAELLREAEALVERGSAMDPASAEAGLVRAYLRVVRDPRRMEGAAEAFERALELDPADAEGHHQYGQTLMALGRFDEARRAYHRALELEPERSMTLVPLAAIAAAEGRLDEALRWSDSIGAVDPANTYALASRTFLQLARGDIEDALVASELAQRLDQGHRVPVLSARAAALAASGESGAARSILGDALVAAHESVGGGRSEGSTVPEVADGGDVVALPALSPTAAHFLALALVAMGEPARAVELLERANPRGAWLWFYLQHPVLDEIREDPRFRRVIEEADPR